MDNEFKLTCQLKIAIAIDGQLIKHLFIPIFPGNGEDEDDQMPTSIFAYPHSATGFMKFWWVFTFPIKLVLRVCIPHPIRHRRLYPLSFIMCIICIGANAYMIVWMLTAFGVAIRVPTIVMGLTFLAAGSTMPEAVSSLISLRNGNQIQYELLPAAATNLFCFQVKTALVSRIRSAPIR